MGESCEVCNIDDRHDPNHNNSEIHRFNFLLWEFKNYRKAIAKNRHGLEVNIEPKIINNMSCESYSNVNGGIHSISILTEQLLLHKNTVIFCCTVKNCRKDQKVHLTTAMLLHPDRLFTLVDPNKNLQQDVTLTLEPGAFYEFQIHFCLEQLTTGSFKIPLACSFQDEKENTFTIARSLVVNIDNEKELIELAKKSPFTKEHWSGACTTIPPSIDKRFLDHWPIPRDYYRSLMFGLDPSHRILSNTDRAKIWEIRSYKTFHIWVQYVTRSTLQEVTMTVKNDNVLVLEVPGLAEKRPSVIPGDYIEIRLHDDHVVYKGVVKVVGDKTIDVYYVDETVVDHINNNPNLEMDVRFILGRLPYERMHEGVEIIVRSGLVSVLFPDDDVRSRVIGDQKTLGDSDFINRQVGSNPEQKNAVNKILYRTLTNPYIVFGPPGTGKTVTIVEAILQIKERTNKRILVCAPANAACDMITTKLAAHCDTKDLIRLHSNIRETGTIADIVRKYSNINSEGDVERFGVGQLLSYRIVVTTLILAGGYQNKDYSPDYIFIDEAAQAMEPETISAIALLPPGKQIILAGDPKQLGPMISSKKCQEYKMDISLLERLMNYEIYNTYHEDFITMLKLNFRSHPDILKIPNDLFYDNKLIAVSEFPERDPVSKLAIYPLICPRPFKKEGVPKGFPIEFCSVSEKERREGSSPSYFNPAEVKMVINYVKYLIAAPLSQFRVTSEEIGIVTPYKRQVSKIQVGLKRNGFQDVEVGTTESFQGREKRVLIISTVRAQHSLLHHDRKYSLGFVKNKKRFNVAVTRAISKLIVIGCPAVLSTDRRQWLRLIETCEYSNSFFGPSYVRRNQEFKSEVIRRMTKTHLIDAQYNN